MPRAKNKFCNECNNLLLSTLRVDPTFLKRRKNPPARVSSQFWKAPWERPRERYSGIRRVDLL